MGAALTAVPQAFTMTAAHEAEREAAKFNSLELRNSARLEESNAAASLRQGALQSGLYRTRGSMLQGTQRVALATSGVDAGSGTAADVLASTDIFSELDASTARNNAFRAAMGQKTVAARYRAEQGRIDARWGWDGSGNFFSPADAEFTAKLGTYALGSALSVGMGGALGGG